MKNFLSGRITINIPHMRDRKTEEGYIPKKSRRVKRKHSAPADGDTWTESVVIVDKESGERRSYFRSKLTNKCYWDEPPSGATNIILFDERRS